MTTDDHEISQTDVAGSGLMEPTRCGYLAILGAPNAGKSTLMNQLVGAKVSIVTHKVQTTRAIVRGIAMHGSSQIVLVDTPGIFEPRKRLERAMVKTAWSGAANADLIAFLLDARRGVEAQAEQVLEGIASAPQPRLLLLNKVDIAEREVLLALGADLNERIRFDRSFMISALTGDGVQDVLRHVAGQMPLGPWLYPEDDLSDLPLRALAAEITREQIFMRLHEELPYESTVETTRWTDQRDGSVRMEQTIFVKRDSQKKIVLGKGGQTIKAISSAARRKIGEAIDARTHLFLFVKVRKNWMDDPEHYTNMGLDYSD